jgi:hypothetical protein
MQPTADLEVSPSWLEGLERLNGVIAATGERLEGNLFYDRFQDDFVGSAPNALLRPKRDRFRRALSDRTRMLEVGVNGGHSAYLALTTNPGLEFHGVDICDHAYVQPAIRWLQEEFPDRVFFYEGDCLKVLPDLAKAGQRFDCFHIDGGKQTYLRDILNCHRLATKGGALAIVDDMQMSDVADVWSRCLRLRLLAPDERFPAMSTEIKYRNAIGVLEPVSLLRLTLLKAWVRRDPLGVLAHKVARRIGRLAQGDMSALRR